MAASELSIVQMCLQACAGQLYRRPVPMQILTVQQTCARVGWARNAVARADHLSRMSLTNKIDFARLHGVTLEVIANPVSQPAPSRICQSSEVINIIVHMLHAHAWPSHLSCQNGGVHMCYWCRKLASADSSACCCRQAARWQ